MAGGQQPRNRLFRAGGGRAVAELDGDLTHIGLAYVLEIGAAFAEKCPTLPGAAAIRLDDTNRAEFEALITQLSDSSQTVRDSAQKRLRESLPTSAVVIHAHRAETDPNAARAIHELLAAYWRERAITEYDAAFERAISDDITSTGTVMISVLPLILGFQLILQALVLDIAETPK